MSPEGVWGLVGVCTLLRIHFVPTPLHIRPAAAAVHGALLNVELIEKDGALPLSKVSVMRLQ